MDGLGNGPPAITEGQAHLMYGDIKEGQLFAGGLTVNRRTTDAKVIEEKRKPIKPADK